MHGIIHYIVVFKNPCYKLENYYWALQIMYPHRKGVFEVFEKAAAKYHYYLLFDLARQKPDSRLRTHFFR